MKNEFEGGHDPDERRPYRMRARLRAVEETRQRVLQATYDLWLELSYDDLTLEAVGRRAGVSRQTVHRQFGSKEDLIVAVTDWQRSREDEQARSTEPGDVEAAIRNQVDRYERMGDAIVRFLQLEGRIEAVDYMLEAGRQGHRDWLEHVFGPHLPRREEDASDREQLVLALYAATDVMTWKLLRRDFGRPRDVTESTILRLVRGALPEGEGEGSS